MSDYTFVLPNGTARDLELDYGLKVLSMTGYGMPILKDIVLDYAQGDGTLHQKTLAAMRVIHLVGKFNTNATPVGPAMHSLRKKLIADINRDALNDTPFTFRYYGANKSTPIDIKAMLFGGLEGGKLTGGVEDVTLELHCHDPFWRATAQTTAALASTAALTGATYLAERDNGTWAALAAGGRPAANPSCIAFAYPQHSAGDWHHLYLGIGNNVYRYDGAAWTSWATNGAVRAIGAGAFGGSQVIVGGDFTTINGVGVNKLAAWNGATWSDWGDPALGNVYGVTATGIYVVMGGAYGAGGGAAKLFGYSRPASWSTAGNGTAILQHSLTSNIWYAVADGVWEQAVNRTPTATPNGAVNCIVNASNGDVYIGGAFTTVNSVTALRVAKFNGTSWSQVGQGLNGTVNGLAFDENGVLFATGAFTDAGMPYIAKLVGGVWVPTDISLPVAGTGIAFRPYLAGHTAASLAVAFGSATLPVVGGVTAITNAGDHQAQPLITINRAGGSTATLKSILNVTTGAALVFNNYALADGETVTIDLTTVPSTVTSSNNGNILGAVISGLDQFGISPGANNYSLSMDLTGSPTFTANAAFYSSFWSADGVAA